jgi:hypothetical protein
MLPDIGGAIQVAPHKGLFEKEHWVNSNTGFCTNIPLYLIASPL